MTQNVTSHGLTLIKETNKTMCLKYLTLLLDFFFTVNLLKKQLDLGIVYKKYFTLTHKKIHIHSTDQTSAIT